MPVEEGYTEALEAATSPRPTVLVVEDEPNIRELVCLHLGLENYDCVQCGDGEAALKLARTRSFDLVILDVMRSTTPPTSLSSRTTRASTSPPWARRCAPTRPTSARSGAGARRPRGASAC